MFVNTALNIGWMNNVLSNIHNKPFTIPIFKDKQRRASSNPNIALNPDIWILCSSSQYECPHKEEVHRCVINGWLLGD